MTMRTRTAILLGTLVLLVFVADLQAFYNPGTRRWINRDPIGETGGKNLYGFAENDGLNRWDADGRFIPHLHLLITAAAGSSAGISQDCVTKIASANANTDLWHPFDHSYHFTRPVRGDKATALRASEDRRDKLLSSVCELARKGQCGKALKNLGMGLHIAQDYYSHVIHGEPVSFTFTGPYPPDDDPNHRDHGRDEDPGQALLATIESIFILAGKKACLSCCCRN
jgi:hypothetical protein